MEYLTPKDFEDDNPLSTIGRRVFIKGLGFVSVALLVSTMGGCDKLAEAIKNRPVRRRIRTGSAEVDADLVIYKDAVKAMKDLPASNPISWAAQATIHGIPSGFNFCEHGTNHFFDWHRAYLFYFEKICQKLTNKPKFGLPYWNWNQNPAINPAFLDNTSSLFHSPRPDTNMTGLWEVSNDALNPIMGDSNFFTFMSQLEGTPHNSVHCEIGGTMCDYTSALDPVFWTHHCMIDYCWAKWNMELENNNTNDATWTNHVNSHFVDADGNPAEFNAAATTIMPLLSYRYETSAIGGFAAASELTTKAAFEKVEKRVRAGANIRFDIKKRVRLADRAAVSIARPFSKETRLAPQDFAQIVNTDTSKDRIFATIEFASLPAHSDFSVRVFVNLPNASSATPTQDPHFAGSFAFFGSTGHSTGAGPHKPHQPKFLVNLTNTIQRLRESGQLNEGTPLSLQLVPVPFDENFERPDTQLELTAIEIITTPVIINPPPQ